tara:strand:+ start:141 stop:515 length:375 start_codon:yes stop_codon:yes gene_type:complete
MAFIDQDEVVDGAGDTWVHEKTNYLLDKRMGWFCLHKWKNRSYEEEKPMFSETLLLCRNEYYDADGGDLEYTHLVIYHHFGRSSVRFAEEEIGFGGLEQCIIEVEKYLSSRKYAEDHHEPTTLS